MSRTIIGKLFQSDQLGHGSEEPFGNVAFEMLRMNFRRALSIAIIAVLSACQSRRAEDDRSPAMRLYLAQLADWKRDSSIIDSLSRLIDTDSLLRLRRAVLRAGTDLPYRQAMMCEYSRWTWQHGHRPAEKASERIYAAFTPQEMDRYRRITSTGAGVSEVNESLCGPAGKAAPKEVDGVSLFELRVRPLHPDSTRPPPP